MQRWDWFQWGYVFSDIVRVEDELLDSQVEDAVSMGLRLFRHSKDISTGGQ